MISGPRHVAPPTVRRDRVTYLVIAALPLMLAIDAALRGAWVLAAVFLAACIFLAVGAVREFIRFRAAVSELRR